MDEAGLAPQHRESVVRINGNRSSATKSRTFAIQFAGLRSERWFFLARANHRQNLCCQAMS
ncbi:MAG: hypothetical protein ABI593_00600 [Betaproteobacteria bacterium]